MGVRYTRARLARPALLALAFAGLVPCHAADSHPQEVLDLVAAYDALAMKVRPLQKRVEAAKFQPEGAPVRARADAESRAAERLRHKNRAVSQEEAGQLLGRLGALEKRVLAERERISRPGYGAGLRGAKTDDESRRKLAALEQEFAKLEREVGALERR